MRCAPVISRAFSSQVRGAVFDQEPSIGRVSSGDREERRGADTHRISHVVEVAGAGRYRQRRVNVTHGLHNSIGDLGFIRRRTMSSVEINQVPSVDMPLVALRSKSCSRFLSIH